MHVTFLGTGGSVITAERNGVSILVDDDILIDCGEGTAKRLLEQNKIKALSDILLTHFHLDHSIGIFSILWHFWLVEKRAKTLGICGPTNIKAFIDKILELTSTPLPFPYSIKYHEFKSPDNMKYHEITALKVIHHIETLAYRIDRKKSLCYTADTGPFDKLAGFAKNCHVLIHEASISDKHSEWAHKYFHCTPKDAALNAKKANVKLLVLTHVMPQAENEKNVLLLEAQKYFDGEIILAEDLKEIDI